MKLSLLSFLAAAATPTLASAIGPRDTPKGYPLTITAFVHCESDCIAEGMGDLTVTQTIDGMTVGENMGTFASNIEDNTEKGRREVAEIKFDGPTVGGPPRTVYVYHAAKDVDAQCNITVAGDLEVPTVNWDFFPQKWKKEHNYEELELSQVAGEGGSKVAPENAERRLEMVCGPAPVV